MIRATRILLLIAALVALLGSTTAWAQRKSRSSKKTKATAPATPKVSDVPREDYAVWDRFGFPQMGENNTAGYHITFGAGQSMMELKSSLGVKTADQDSSFLTLNGAVRTGWWSVVRAQGILEQVENTPVSGTETEWYSWHFADAGVSLFPAFWKDEFYFAIDLDHQVEKIDGQKGATDLLKDIYLGGCSFGLAGSSFALQGFGTYGIEDIEGGQAGTLMRYGGQLSVFVGTVDLTFRGFFEDEELKTVGVVDSQFTGWTYSAQLTWHISPHLALSILASQASLEDESPAATGKKEKQFGQVRLTIAF